MLASRHWFIKKKCWCRWESASAALGQFTGRLECNYKSTFLTAILWFWKWFQGSLPVLYTDIDSSRKPLKYSKSPFTLSFCIKMILGHSCSQDFVTVATPFGWHSNFSLRSYCFLSYHFFSDRNQSDMCQCCLVAFMFAMVWCVCVWPFLFVHWWVSHGWSLTHSPDLFFLSTAPPLGPPCYTLTAPILEQLNAYRLYIYINWMWMHSSAFALTRPFKWTSPIFLEVVRLIFTPFPNKPQLLPFCIGLLYQAGFLISSKSSPPKPHIEGYLAIIINTIILINLNGAIVILGQEVMWV